MEIHKAGGDLIRPIMLSRPSEMISANNGRVRSSNHIGVVSEQVAPRFCVRIYTCLDSAHRVSMIQVPLIDKTPTQINLLRSIDDIGPSFGVGDFP